MIGLYAGRCKIVSQLEFVLLQGLERRGAAAERVVFSHAVKNVDPAIVKQGGLRNRASGCGRTDDTLLQGFFAKRLNSFKTVPFRALVLVKRHNRLL